MKTSHGLTDRKTSSQEMVCKLRDELELEGFSWVVETERSLGRLNSVCKSAETL